MKSSTRCRSTPSCMAASFVVNESAIRRRSSSTERRATTPTVLPLCPASVILPAKTPRRTRSATVGGRTPSTREFCIHCGTGLGGLDRRESGGEWGVCDRLPDLRYFDLDGCNDAHGSACQSRPKKAFSWQGLLEGWRYARRWQDLLGTYLIDMNAVFFGMPNALFPAMAEHSGARLHWDCSMLRLRSERC